MASKDHYPESLGFFYFMETKKCSKCKEVKKIEEYRVSARSSDGKDIQCKACRKATEGLYRSNNKEEFKQRRKDWYNDNKEHVLAYQKNYIESKGIKGKYMPGSKYFNTYVKVRSSTDPIFKLKKGIRCLISQSFKRTCEGTYKKEERSVELLGCTLEFFMKHIQDKFTEGMTQENYGEWHLDHIIPLATAKTREDVVKLNHYTNFQPLWAKDNLAKGAKIINKSVASY